MINRKGVVVKVRARIGGRRVRADQREIEGTYACGSRAGCSTCTWCLLSTRMQEDAERQNRCREDVEREKDVEKMSLVKPLILL